MLLEMMGLANAFRLALNACRLCTELADEERERERESRRVVGNLVYCNKSSHII